MKIKLLINFKLVFSVFMLLTATKFFSQENSIREINSIYLSGFSVLPPFDEQVKNFLYDPEVKIQINAPSPEKFDINKPVGIALFALPNGNSTDWTFGKKLKAGDDWHYDIQHIGAQTRFLREHNLDYNLVTVYLETTQLSWPTWRSNHSNNAALIRNIVDSIKNIFADNNPFVVLTGHSGGGSFTFGFMNGGSTIPDYIERISFLDSDYNYDNNYGEKLLTWLNASPKHFLSVLAYNDSIALYNGLPVVSPTGGTWYRSKLMQNYFKNYFQFTSEENSDFIKYTALDGRIKFILKHNPERKILHTVQVELNGFIQGMVSGTSLEGVDYVYYGSRAYTQYVQSNLYQVKQLTIPARPAGAKTGTQFMQFVNNMSFDDRETEIFNEISKGNIPDFLRILRTNRSSFNDVNGALHKCYYQVMPDYLAIGSNDDFCRVPMGPKTAQKLATLFGATMPTPKLVDDIYLNADLKLTPVSYLPVGNANELVTKFIEHNQAIEQQRISSGKPLGVVVGGIKKDVVISNKIVDPAKPNHVVIYGWHKLDGTPIQPVYNGHIDSYVDYSHGIRLLSKEIIIDSLLTTVSDVLRDSVKYKILSNESGQMYQPSYFRELNIPYTPQSFGIKTEGSTALRIIVKPDTSVKTYKVKIGKDGLTFGKTVTLQPDNLIVTNLQTDSLFFIKIVASNSAGDSPPSEVLAGVPSTEVNAKLIIVNGFDRASTGNTFNFIRQHATAFHQNNFKSFCSATNNAIIDGLFNLNDYSAADYILGEESTVDETFSVAEQTKVKSFLSNGGKLFVTGSEVAWDLDYKGTTSDKSFINNFLKIKYAADAPNGAAGTIYQTEPLINSIFSGISSFYFDNGTQGTINVKYPDVVKPVNNGIGLLKYVGVDTSAGYAGIYFEGVFTGGSTPGKLVCFGFPFETVYPQSKRTEVAKKIIDFFDLTTKVDEEFISSSPKQFFLSQNYPNPFNSTTIIEYSVPLNARNEMSNVSLKVFDILGKEIATLVDEKKSSGSYKVTFDASYHTAGLPSGIYIYRLKAGNYVDVKKFILLK
ncbi:MAG: T9SS type A sorting domain-containing protein [Ignavibacteriales bacterium]|nr:T9SS type A sorting domain-containing protein [Ignavibacteriales bacterium]